MLSEKYSHLHLRILPQEFEYIQFETDEQFNFAIKLLSKNEIDYFSFCFKGERSLVCHKIQSDFEFKKKHDGWIGIKVEGEMPFGTVQGLISTISGSLAEQGIGICVISTFLTDIFLLRISNIDKAIARLKSQGWTIGKDSIP
jgi:hypothetical protein